MTVPEVTKNKGNACVTGTGSKSCSKRMTSADDDWDKVEQGSLSNNSQITNNV